MTISAISSRPALHHDIVALEDGIDHPLADAGPGEDRFGEDGAGQQQADLQADGGDHRDQRIAQGMQADDAAVGEALGAGGADIVLAQHLEHGRARLPGDDGERNGAEHDRGQDQVAQRRDGSASDLPWSSVSISMKPVIGLKKNCRPMRPETGVQPR